MGIGGKVFNRTGTTGNFGRAGLMALALVSCSAEDAPADVPSEGIAIAGPVWSPRQVDTLLRHARAAPDDGLPCPDLTALEAERSATDATAIDSAATALALELARMHLLGVASRAQRAGWQIEDSDARIDLPARLQQALAEGTLDAFLDGLRPLHSDYAALRSAYAAEKDPARRRTIARNMERWRWMPQSLGQAYVLVNAASFEAGLWREGRRVRTWRVVVGKPATPSPVFAARITGVTLNPWWDIPSSIVREKHGNFPASQGYVRTATGFRQKPGPNNALGVMKLVMPNPHSVYLHDTPSKSLFARDSRAFSHGCIRVANPLDLAATLLAGVRTRAQIDAAVASKQTATIALAAPLPVYVTYFTATVLEDGSFAIKPDIYGRDARLSAPEVTGQSECSGSPPA